jgi:hypothetical protein
MFARIVGLTLIGVSAAGAADAPPNVSLQIPEAFNVRVSKRQFEKGQVIVASPAYARMTALASFTEYSGVYGDPAADQDHSHAWTVAVHAVASQKVIAAHAKAKDGYEARLNRCPEFLGCGDESYMYARFERKRFRWGYAISFLSQFTQDAALYVPHNGHLTYEVWGVTRDHRYTVVATVPVSHPKLAGWVSEARELRDARSLSELKKDKDYKLVERCRPAEFEPSLKAFDQLIDTLSFGKTSNQAMERTPKAFGVADFLSR